MSKAALDVSRRSMGFLPSSCGVYTHLYKHTSTCQQSVRCAWQERGLAEAAIWILREAHCQRRQPRRQ